MRIKNGLYNILAVVIGTIVFSAAFLAILFIQGWIVKLLWNIIAPEHALSLKAGMAVAMLGNMFLGGLRWVTQK
jgi:hypothetical protein